MSKTVLGTMTFGATSGGPTSEEDSCSMMATFLQGGSHIELDTAFMYEQGESERIIGRFLQKQPGLPVFIATKANPWEESGKSLSPESIRFQLTSSLKNLQRENVDLFYLHGPDYNTPIEQTLSAVNELHKEGKFKELGLSNFAAWQVTNIVHICRKNGWIVPTVYQGMYNAITRNVEEELFQALREFGIRFYAFNPLAGGLLSGRYRDFEEKPSEGRFSTRPHYLARYWKKEVFDGINMIIKECEKHNISLAEASFRWMTSHSLLETSKGDGIIIGASKRSHYDDNMRMCADRTPLPQEIVDAFDKAWKITKADSPMYFKPKPKGGASNKLQ